MRTYEPKTPVAAPPRLVVGSAHHRLEAAADRLADEVVTGWRSGGSLESALATDQVVRRRAVVGDAGGVLDRSTSGAIDAARRGGSPLEPSTRTHMEDALGADFSRVRVHADQQAGELCDSVRAKAFTVGSHIFFRGGRPDPSSAKGQHLLAHELAHVTQQSSPHVIRRAYLDSPADTWVPATTRVQSVTGRTRGRKPEMRRIDAAVEATRLAWLAGRLPLVEMELAELQNAINAWRASKGGREAMRAVDVGVLEAEGKELSKTIGRMRGPLLNRAVGDHLDHQRWVDEWVEEGLNQNRDIRLRNSCQWVRSNKANFFVVTQTGDAKWRTERVLASKGKQATARDTCFFPDPDSGEGALNARPGSENAYNPDDATDMTNVVLDKKINGWRKPGIVVVTDVAIGNRDKSSVWQTLKHEVQHAADLHLGTKLQEGITGAKSPGEKTAQEALNLYKTEYRAHAYQGSRDLQTHATVLKHIRDDYPKVDEAWGGQNPTPWQRWFRRKVDAYRSPDVEGFNKYNSTRIDDLLIALDGVGARTDNPDAPGMDRVLVAVRALDRHDVDYIRDEDEAKMLREKVQGLLFGPAKEAFNAAIPR